MKKEELIKKLKAGETDLKKVFPKEYNKMNKSQFMSYIKSEFGRLGDKFKTKKINNVWENDFFKISNNFELILKVSSVNSLLREPKEVFEPKTIRDFALIHATHNSKINKNYKLHFFTRPVFQKNSEQYGSCVFQNGEIYSKLKPNARLIIVENKEIFNLEDLLTYFKSFDVLGICKKDIVLYGEGNAITAKIISPKFFEQFKEILYFGDYDQEGYNIFKRINFGDANARFVLPKKEILKVVQKEMSYLEKLIDKTKYSDRKNNGVLDKECSIYHILNYIYPCKYEMQQEAFLDL